MVGLDAFNREKAGEVPRNSGTCEFADIGPRMQGCEMRAFSFHHIRRQPRGFHFKKSSSSGGWEKNTIDRICLNIN